MERWTENGWTVRVKPPSSQDQKPRDMILIHGLQGNEDVMWIFSGSIPPTYWLLAPRGPIETGEGFSWVKTSNQWPTLMDFAPSSASLMIGLDQLLSKLGLSEAKVDVMGFSQGAAMAYALAAFYPSKINRLFALAGFLPNEDQMPGRYTALANKAVYMAHGTRDDTVPISMAEEAAQILESVGANVSFCASDTGHKLSPSCLRGLESFLQTTESPLN
jgi:phospholipase/carboxylesterase